MGLPTKVHFVNFVNYMLVSGPERPEKHPFAGQIAPSWLRLGVQARSFFV